MTKITYQDAGVNIDAGNQVVNKIKHKIATTFTPNILSQIGGFAAMIDLAPIIKEYSHPVLVQSIDGVGTKTIIAKLLNKYDTLGIDLLSASCNDILVTGAKPLTLLDYVAADRLNPDIVESIIEGMVKACRENGVALVGGETAEMPNIYLPNEHDLVGIVTGVVEKSKIIDGQNIQPGDKILGLKSNGLHTNGYSLARKILFEIAKFGIDTTLPELDQPLGETLLAPHLNYTKPIQALLNVNLPIKGMAHITGGGLTENIPRILPKHCQMQIYEDSWPIPPIFKIIQKFGNVVKSEMYRTFNMGIGFVVIVASQKIDDLNHCLSKHGYRAALEIGEIIEYPQKK